MKTVTRQPYARMTMYDEAAYAALIVFFLVQANMLGSLLGFGGLRFTTYRYNFFAYALGSLLPVLAWYLHTRRSFIPVPPGHRYRKPKLLQASPVLAGCGLCGFLLVTLWVGYYLTTFFTNDLDDVLRPDQVMAWNGSTVIATKDYTADDLAVWIDQEMPVCRGIAWKRPLSMNGSLRDYRLERIDRHHLRITYYFKPGELPDPVCVQVVRVD